MSPLMSPLRLPEQTETEYQREQRVFAAQLRDARKAQQQKRAALLKAFFRVLLKRKGRGSAAPSSTSSVRV